MVLGDMDSFELKKEISFPLGSSLFRLITERDYIIYIKIKNSLFVVDDEMIKRNESLCPLCVGEKPDGKTTFTVDYQDTVIVVQDVPAMVCAMCGHEWIADDVAEVLEAIVNDAKARQPSVKIIKYRKVA